MPDKLVEYLVLGSIVLKGSLVTLYDYIWVFYFYIDFPSSVGTMLIAIEEILYI